MKETKQFLKVGNFTPATAEREAVIDRAYYGQGWIFKDEETFLRHPERVCYVPELSDNAYTRQDFLAMCNGQENLAEECFYAVDWQHPETWVEEQFTMDEWRHCPQCDRIYQMEGEPRPCPACGNRPDEGEENADTESERRPAESGGL